MERIYQHIIRHHLKEYRQMVFLPGPRQVGKTTLSKACVMDQYQSIYLNWDNINHREIILAGTEAIYQQLQPNTAKEITATPVIIFDEIHKYAHWKNRLKGYFDLIQEQCKIIVTGSAKLNVYRRGGDSMMGRYFLYRIHPLSVAELVGRPNCTAETQDPKKIPQQEWDNLFQYGGFPEPFLQSNHPFYQRWMTLKQEQLFHEDLREISHVSHLAQCELLAQLLKQQVGGLITYSELAKKVRVSEPTIRHWIDILNNLYYCFLIKPWSTNIAHSLLKTPKAYLWDWSVINDRGAKIENFVACHLRKATHFWTDIGLGQYDLFYLRDKEKREVDFLITKNAQPWLVVEVKTANHSRLSQHLIHFNQQLKAPHVLQAVYDMPYLDVDCFSYDQPMIVPLSTLLSQLV
jgi:uncharacterized protein